MSSTIALFLCTIFVLFLLRMDRREAPEASRALWIPTLWILIHGSKALGIWFGAGVDEEGSPLDRIVLSGLICLGMLLIAARKGDWIGAIKENSWLFLLVAYMLASSLWSEIPYISFKRWTRELGTIVMALLILT